MRNTWGLLGRQKAGGAAPWDPSALAAKTLYWLRADSGVTGTTWTDKTNGNVFTATTVTQDSSGLNGQKRIVFPNSTSNDLLCSGLTSSASKAHGFVVGKLGGAGLQAIWDNANGAAPAAFFDFGGNVYECFGSSLRYGPTANSLGATDSFAYEVKADASGNWNQILNGSTIATNTGNTVAWGANAYVGCNSNPNPMNGEIEEILVLHDNMTGPEHASWVAYVLARYGIAA